MKIAHIIVSIFVLLGTVHESYSQAYRCKDAAGKMAYQQVPCTAGQDQKEIKLAPVEALTPDEQRLNRAIASGKVARGMTAGQVRRAWGAPTEINTGVYDGRISEQWVYDRGNFRSQYVYIEDDMVTSIQSPKDTSGLSDRDDPGAVRALR